MLESVVMPDVTFMVWMSFVGLLAIAIRTSCRGIFEDRQGIDGRKKNKDVRGTNSVGGITT